MTPPQKDYREILLTQGQVAVVDATMFELLSRWKWQARWCPDTNSFYAGRCEPCVNGVRHHIPMHRQILGLGFGDKRKADHRNGDTLDNRTENLRIATASQNAHNRRKQSGCSNIRKGIHFNKREQKYKPRIAVNGARLNLGAFSSFEDACRVREAAEQQYHGEFALNRDPTKTKKE